MAKSKIIDKDIKKLLNSKAFNIKVENTPMNFNREVELYTLDYTDEFPMGAYFTAKYDSLISNCVYDDKLNLDFVPTLIKNGYKLIWTSRKHQLNTMFPLEQVYEKQGILIQLKYRRGEVKRKLSDMFEEPEEPTLDTTIPQRIIARMYYNDDSLLDEVIALAKKHIVHEQDKAKISLVVSTRSGLATVPQDIKHTDIDIAGNYGEGFVKVHNKIVEQLNDPLGKGLVLLHGTPGTGKTSYIRHLCKEIKKEIIFLPPFLAENISGPDFIPFLLDHTNSILIIEDAEKVVLDREGDGSNRQSVANLLNMTDGILSDCLSIQILATFNTTRDRIDKALLRKGRLIAEWKFDALDVDHSNRLLSKLGKDYTTTVPMTLTDIYNLDEELNVVQQETKIGFRNY
jgi:hypothetical protein